MHKYASLPSNTWTILTVIHFPITRYSSWLLVVSLIPVVILYCVWIPLTCSGRLDGYVRFVLRDETSLYWNTMLYSVLLVHPVNTLLQQTRQHPLPHTHTYTHTYTHTDSSSHLHNFILSPFLTFLAWMWSLRLKLTHETGLHPSAPLASLLWSHCCKACYHHWMMRCLKGESLSFCQHTFFCTHLLNTLLNRPTLSTHPSNTLSKHSMDPR